MKKVCKGYYEYKGYIILHDGGNSQWSVQREDDFFNSSWFDTKADCKKYIDEMTDNG